VQRNVHNTAELVPRDLVVSQTHPTGIELCAGNGSVSKTLKLKVIEGKGQRGTGLAVGYFQSSTSKGNRKPGRLQGETATPRFSARSNRAPPFIGRVTKHQKYVAGGPVQSSAPTKTVMCDGLQLFVGAPPVKWVVSNKRGSILSVQQGENPAHRMQRLMQYRIHLCPTVARELGP